MCFLLFFREGFLKNKKLTVHLALFTQKKTMFSNQDHVCMLERRGEEEEEEEEEEEKIRHNSHVYQI